MARKSLPTSEGVRLSARLILLRLADGKEAYHYSEADSPASTHVFPADGFIPKRVKKLIQKSIPRVPA